MRTLSSRRGAVRDKKRIRTRQLWLERLEDRQLLAVGSGYAPTNEGVLPISALDRGVKVSLPAAAIPIHDSGEGESREPLQAVNASNVATSPYFNDLRSDDETNAPELAVLTQGLVAPVDGKLQISFSASDDTGLAAAPLTLTTTVTARPTTC
jgi:hypothetical protein